VVTDQVDDLLALIGQQMAPDLLIGQPVEQSLDHDRPLGGEKLVDEDHDLAEGVEHRIERVAH